jgi:hypothetical protein
VLLAADGGRLLQPGVELLIELFRRADREVVAHAARPEPLNLAEALTSDAASQDDMDVEPVPSQNGPGEGHPGDEGDAGLRRVRPDRAEPADHPGEPPV